MEDRRPYQLRREHWILLAGLLFFLGVKGAFVLGQTTAMGMPRLGDDAFTHLWRAKQIGEVGLFGALQGEARNAARGPGDIYRLCSEDRQAPAPRRAIWL